MTTPSIQLPGSFGIPVAAPVYVDGIPLSFIGVPSARSSSSQDFWSTQPRMAGDPAVEQLTVTLGQQRLLNYVSLDLPHFPHTVTFWWWDGALWRPVIGSGGVPLAIVTSGSVPAVVDNPAALSARLNPYHYGAGHWVHYEEQVQPVTTSKLMLRAARPAPVAHMQLPVSPARRPVPYPLGVRNLDFGCRILSASDVPPAPRSPVTRSARQPFTTTVDVNGSPVQVALRENRASDMLAGGTWRSGPQPSSSAVTCLYLDSRDGNGAPQLIDRFFIDPVTSGVRFSLYYSRVPPPPGTSFQAIDDPLLPGLVVAAGTQIPVATPQGVSFSQWPGWLTLANQASGTVADAPWWTGIEVMPSFGSDDPGTYVIADAGLLQLSYSAGEWTVTTPTPDDPGAVNQPSGGVLGQWAFDFSPGDRVQFIAGYDGQAFFTWSPLGAMYQTPVTPPVPAAPSFRFGGLLSIDPSQPVLAGNYTLTAFILKQEQTDLTVGGAGGIPPEFLGFAADPAGFVSPPLDSEQGTTLNAVARFSPDFILGTVNPWGFVGGLGSAYEACPWIPVQRSYTLARGFVEFDPVLAAAWKFEFTNLQPEPYEYIQPPQLTASYFLPQDQPTPDQSSPTTPAALEAGLSVSQDIAPSLTFSDAPPPSPAPVPGLALPTEALYAPDATAAAQMASLGGGLYNFQPWQPPHAVPLTAIGGPTSYQQQTITVTSRVAYFAAISSIAMYRTDYTAASDTAQYTDNFQDPGNIDLATLVPGGWSFVPGTGLAAPSNLADGGAQARSLTFNSRHAVTGVQFATIQSDPVQLLDDADFSAPGFASWGPVGDAQPLAESANSAQLGVMAQVSRGAGAPELGTLQAPDSWAYLESTFASWAALQAGIPSWLDFGQQAATTAMGGIAYTGPPVATTGAGRLHAAARVFSSAALSAPLYLQLIDGQTGTVIAEAEQDISGGSITEWFAGFTIGEGLVSQSTWSQAEAAYPTWAAIATAAPSWQDIDTTQAPLGTTVTVQLVQKVSTADTWDVDNISVFEDSIVWEFSNDGGGTWYPAYDVRNNPRGVVTFPLAAPGQGTQLKWRVSAYRPGLTVSALAIRPWYETWPLGIPPRSAGVGHGPNVSPLDHYGPVELDPRWQLSSSPLPDSWYFSVRQALDIVTPASDFPGPAVPLPAVTLGSALVWEPPAVAGAIPQTYSDIYSDTYTDQYAPADGGDVYTDAYCDVYGQDYLVITGVQRLAAAALSANAILSADAITIPLPAYGLGADLGPVAATDPSVAAWISGTALPLPARRIALGNQIPASLAASPAAGDAGVRRVLFDVRPDATTTPAQLDTFLASCQAGGLHASVSIWAGADAAFANLADWLALLPDYAAIVHRNGYQVVLTVDNHSIARNWLAAWYPGDSVVDVIAPTFWCTGPAPGSGGDTLAVAQAFADAHGKPLGLAGFGVDHARYTVAQGQAYVSYVQRLFTARNAAARQSYDLLWLGTGTYSVLTAPSGLMAAYRSLAQAL
jgi:hypothetical protein